MKKKFIIIPTCLSLVTLLGVGLAIQNDSFFETKAASNSAISFSDDFDSNEGLNPIWENNGAALTTDGYSLRIHPEKYIWGDCLALNKFYLDKNTKIEFTARCLNGTGAWLAMGLGSYNPSYHFYDCQYGFAFCQGVTMTLKNDGSALANHSAFFEFSPFGEEKINIYHKVVLELNKFGNDYYCNYSVYKASDSTLIGTSSNIPLGNVDGYIVFSDSLCDAEVSSLTISQGGEVVYSDDFSTSTVSYPDGGVNDPTWTSVGFTKTDVSLGRFGKLDLTKANTGVRYGEKLSNVSDGMIDESYSIDVKLHYSEMALNAVTGFMLTDDSSESNYFALRKEVLGYTLLHMRNSSVIKEQMVMHEDADGFADLTLVIHTSGLIELTNGVESISNKINFTNGYLGLYSLFTPGSESDKGGCIDDIVINKSTYIKSDAPDVSNNFNGTKTTMFDDREMHEFYINLKEWNLGTNVKVTPYTTKTKNNGYLMFTSASEDSAFSPRVKYTDYIARFDVEVTSKSFANGASLGLQFGKYKFNDLYANVPSLGILYNTGPTLVAHTNSRLDPAYSEEMLDANNIPTNYFTGEVLNFLFVVKDNMAEMHFKRAADPDSELYKVRAVAKVASTYGYPAVYGCNGISFTMDNFSITNLDYELTTSNYLGSDYQETARNDFATDTSVKGFTLSNADVSGNALRILSGGSVASLKPLKDNIVRFKVRSIAKKMTIKQGAVEFSINNSGATTSYDVIDGSNSYHEELDNFSLLNSIFELRFTSGQLEVRYVSGSSPLYNINSNVNVYVVNTSSDNIVITSSDGTSQINTLSLFNLDSHVTILPRDYNPDTDYYDPWPERPAIQDKKKGCGGSIVASSLIVAISASAVAVFLLIRRKERKSHEA